MRSRKFGSTPVASKKGYLPRGAVWVASATIALLPSLAQSPAWGQGPVFTKSLAEVNGVPVTSPPPSLANGDLLTWVMTYQFDHDPSQPAQTNIQDLLPATLQYVAGSLQAPPSWNRQWFDGSSWVLSEPVSARGAGAVISFPNVTPSGAGETFPLPSPTGASINTAGSGGDGYRAIPYNGKMHVVNHHTFGTYLDCFDAILGTRCPGYPAHVPVTSGTTYIGNSNGDNGTAWKPYEYLDRVAGKLYFPVVSPIVGGYDLGVLCADVIQQTSCGFYSLLSVPSANERSIQGIGAVGGKVYVQLPNGGIGCLDTTAAIPTPCAGQPYPVAASASGIVNEDSSEIVGTKIYSIWLNSTGTAPFILSCFDTTTNLSCAGWGGNKTPDPLGRMGILDPLLDPAGVVTGICVHTTSPSSAALSCHDLSSGASIAFPSSYATWIQTFNGGPLASLGLGQSGRYGARAFNGRSTGPGAIGCYDFAASPPGPCVEPSWPVTGAAVTDRHYATIADPEHPGCMWYYGDDGKLGAFAAADGLGCDASTLIDVTVTPADSYCAGGAVSGWDELSLAGLVLGGGVTATLSLYDGSNPASLAVKSDGVTPYAQNLPISSLPLILGTAPGGLGIGYGTGPGQYQSLRIVLQFSGVTDRTPWSQIPPPTVGVTWLGGPPQICFETVVVGCDEPFVTNQATAVTTPSSGGPITQAAPNPPFSAVHLLDASCPSTSPDVDVSLVTGWDEISSKRLPRGTADDDWTVAVGSASAQPALLVSQPPAAWPRFRPSEWISTAVSGVSQPGGAPVRFERCFCLAPDATNAKLTMRLWADDQATVLLNGVAIAGPGGQFRRAQPLSVLYMGTVGSSLFQAGNNCVAVVVDDIRHFFVGLDVAGSVWADHGKCAGASY